jgi:hypothetical protein
VWGLQHDAAGQTAPQRKLLSVAEIEALQRDHARLQDESARLVAALGEVQASALRVRTARLRTARPREGR